MLAVTSINLLQIVAWTVHGACPVILVTRMKAEPGVQFLALSSEKPPCSTHGCALQGGFLLSLPQHYSNPVLYFCQEPCREKIKVDDGNRLIASRATVL